MDSKSHCRADSSRSSWTCNAWFVFFCLVASPVAASLIELPALKDNTLYGNEVLDLSNGAGDFLFSGLKGMDGGFETNRALLAFDIAGNIPMGSTITSAVLRLRVDRAPPTGRDDPFYLHLSLSDWGEAGSDAIGNEAGGAAAEIGDATWRHSFYNNGFWSTAGGDFSSGASVTQVVAGLGTYFFRSDEMAADVQSWLDDPAANYGWFLLGDENTARSVRRFDASNPGDPDRMPTLSIGFVVPEPKIIWLFAMGLFVLGIAAKQSKAD